MKGYCGTCFKLINIYGCQRVKLRNNTFAYVGKCPICKNSIIKKDKSKEDIKHNIWENKKNKKEIYKKNRNKIKDSKQIIKKIKEGKENGKKHIRQRSTAR